MKEIIVVDDGSTDATPAVLGELVTLVPQLRPVRMVDTPSGRGHGQSAAFHAGFRHARGRLIAVLDADLQNDPADLPAMLRLMEQTGAHLVQGDRSQARRDTLVRRVSSIVGRVFRRSLLGDSIRDTGCSLRVLTRELLTHSQTPEALAAYEAERWPATSDLVRLNRQNGPEQVMQLVEERAPDGFGTVTEVLSQQELEDIAANYKRVAGFQVDALNAKPPIVAARVG